MVGSQRGDELNLNLLRTFCAIAEEKGITRAAERLGLRQPSVSLALQRLERQLGCRLVHRDSRHFALTGAGQRVYLECQEIVRALGRIDGATRDRRDEATGMIRLLVASSLQSALIDEAIRLVHTRHPAVTWHLEVATSEETVRRVRQEKVRLGLCLLTRPVLGLHCRPLSRVPFAVLCGAEHRLHGRGAIDLHELRREPFVAYTAATEGFGLEPLSALREGAGLGTSVIASSPNLEEVRRLIVAGLGIGILPLTAVFGDLASGLLWQVEVPVQSAGADLVLVTNPEVDLSPAERAFVAASEELAALCPEVTA